MSQADRLITQRRQKLAELRAQGIDPFYNRFQPSHTVAQVVEEFGSLDEAELGGQDKPFRLAGRLMLVRKFGKAI
ncbi:MAG: lysine--tRNA ligase, partial [Thermodesulfobacteriota bacterium]